MVRNESSRDVTRTTLAVLFIGILIGASGWILHPFLTALVWATMFVVATWPLMLALQERLWAKRALAVTVMTVALLLVFIIPFTIAVLSLLERTDDIAGWVKSLATLTLPPAPAWVEQLPFVGPKLADRWNLLASAGPGALSERLAPYARSFARGVIAQAGNAGMLMVQFLLTVIISAILYAKGETAGRGVCRFARRLAGKNGEDAAILAARAIRSVALGVIVTALIQAFLGGIGLAVAGVPAAAVLATVIFILCVAQVGPHLVFIPVVVWLFWKDQNLWGTAMIVWALFVGLLDNFVRPVLIRRGADLPLVLIFAGVIGGLIAFGVIGLFIGPVMLAVTYTLLREWVILGESEEKESSVDAAA
ncbi:AI-2E family transporter YdiK [Desulfuromonas sp. TF]|uniref:AI-2E family transporter YdiK n=1 Tax=Desulfuromonas sp. TF TaxID=1232410 RepID=UPI0004147761|nr:AI-2E family transporter YdiK [Desulfuromonas sp. TF]